MRYLSAIYFQFIYNFAIYFNQYQLKLLLLQYFDYI